MVTYLQQDDTQKIQDGTFSGRREKKGLRKGAKGASVLAGIFCIFYTIV